MQSLYVIEMRLPQTRRARRLPMQALVRPFKAEHNQDHVTHHFTEVCAKVELVFDP
ncbi:hypothetical protein [Stutzerimonas frequens]|uniref:hypothetical protein n=1 Tax=Stutzerimonas frequens TaxID=2968969 RepID=UPI0013A63E57|nr:hypothetical protein [Stutzerimonas frequens]